MTVLIILEVVLVFILIFGPVIFRRSEIRQFNDGYCQKCKHKLRHFDNDSQGGEGWCCDNCGSVIWLSWFHPEGGNADG